MIAIVILGLGLVMVATMFPVAWDRARTMSEYTTQQSILPAIETNLTSLVYVSGPTMNGTGLAGDLIYDPDSDYVASPTTPCAPRVRVWPSDTRVHALNMQNVVIGAGASGTSTRGFVKEDPWRIERMPEVDASYTTPWIWSAILDDANLTPGPDFLTRSYDSGRNNPLATRGPFHQRVHPPLPARPFTTVDPVSGVFLSGSADDAVAAQRWEQALDARRFCWGVLHRLRDYVGFKEICQPGGGFARSVCPLGNDCCLEDAAEDAIRQSRSFDFYFVTLRRSNPTDRYARQDAGDRAQFVPDPCEFTATPKAIPQARKATEDVALPVPWRVQIQLPTTIAARANANGIPTEVLVPPTSSGMSDSAQYMWVSMFPSGTQFVDELTGTVYRVVTRRVSADSKSATLTLDKEITIEDVDLEASDPRCAACFPYDSTAHAFADAEELLRTVWVYPPPIASRESETVVLFSGNSPVVDINVRSLTLSPIDH